MKIITKLIFLTLLLCSIALLGCSEKEQTQETNTKGTLDMQGYELEVPKGYSCSGGFTDGYRYLDAKCKPNKGKQEILVEAGLVVSGIDPEKGLVANQLVARSYEFTKQYGISVCEEYHSEDLQLDAEHYLCIHEMNGKRTITIGTGKSRNTQGWWFESHLQTNPDDKIPNEDYIKELTKFLNSAIKIDWEKFK